MNILEDQQNEIEQLMKENKRLKEELDESLDLGEQLTAQVKTLTEQITKLKSQIKDYQSLESSQIKRRR